VRRLGHLALRRGDVEQALRLALESLALNRAVGDPQGVAACMVAVAAVAATTKQPDRAVRLLAAADSLLVAVGTQLFAADSLLYKQTLASAHEQTGEPDFAAAWTTGEQMVLDTAVAQAVATSIHCHVR